jgi:hypothetical protein
MTIQNLIMHYRILILVSIFSLSFAFTGTTQAPDYPIFGPHNVYSQPLFVKVYYNYITNPNSPWITEATADAQAKASLIYLNSIFNKHNIYIVGRNGYCGEDQATITTSPSNNVFTIRSSIPSVVHDDGIDFYITQGTLPQGYAYNIPNTYLSVEGTSFQNIPVTETEVLVSVIGHCLGLSHTFTRPQDACTQTSTGCTAACSCSGIAPGYCCGDYVNDTEINPYSGAISVIPGTCDPVPTNVTTATTKNFMSNVSSSTCRSEFTAGQVLRMRAYLFEALPLKQIQPNISIGHPTSNTTVWDTPQFPLANIIVPKGHTLVVNATVIPHAARFCA